MNSLPTPASQGKPNLGESNGDREYLLSVLRAATGSSELFQTNWTLLASLLAVSAVSVEDAVQMVPRRADYDPVAVWSALQVWGRIVMTREENDAIDLKVIDFERREKRVAKRRSLEELVINDSDPTATAKNSASCSHGEMIFYRTAMSPFRSWSTQTICLAR